MKKTFPITAVMTMKTAICMGDFGEAHNLAEWVMGHPVWTHELPRLFSTIKRKLEEQFPDLPREATQEDWREVLDSATAILGDKVEVEQGIEDRTINPIDSMCELVGEENVLAVVVAQEPNP